VGSGLAGMSEALIGDRETWLAEARQLAADVASTLRVSALGFAIACVAGVLLPFLLRRSPRVSTAVEPYIMASMGIPKYALAPWLILWFGIGDLPKLVVVTLMVFYIIFITTTAGIRAVDQRLIAMARIAGAGETAIAREIIWKSLLPFFFTGLKVALPRAVSATIVGEFLVDQREAVGRHLGLGIRCEQDLLKRLCHRSVVSLLLTAGCCPLDSARTPRCAVRHYTASARARSFVDVVSRRCRRGRPRAVTRPRA